jgi:para-aminobenzoate synthetase component I
VTDEFLNSDEWQGFAVHLTTAENHGRELIALGNTDSCVISQPHPEALDDLEAWLRQSPEWTFGILSYELHVCTEPSVHPHTIHSAQPALVFFHPLVVAEKDAGSWKIHVNASSLSDATLIEAFDQRSAPHTVPQTTLQGSVSRAEYIRNVESLQRHIGFGDIYEVNYCVPFSAACEIQRPYALWQKLVSRTQAPMSGYFKSGAHILLCASPERYLARTGNTVISQPIKGTIRRGATPQEDEQLKQTLLANPKERSENVMIVDLVRNDLSRAALPGSVHVNELFGIHTFNTVHHMISTVSSEVRGDTSLVELLRNTFPMGSMTGAPKVEAMKLIRAHEPAARGWYSGAMGYIRPNGDFDFNVVIRSLSVDKEARTVSCSVGSAITFHADPEKEYDECLLKLQAIQQVLS